MRTSRKNRIYGCIRRQQGNAIVLTALMGLALIGMAALAIDVGLVWVTRTELQKVADAAALAGIVGLRNTDAIPVGIDSATAVVAMDFYAGAEENEVLRESMSYTWDKGFWDPLTRTYTPEPTDDPFLNTAVRVTVVKDAASGNGMVPTFFTPTSWLGGFNVPATATAWMSYAGGADPGEIELPLVIPCCAVSGPLCKDPYCGTGAPNPAACPDRPDWVCFDFNPTTEQELCWTEFNEASQPVNPKPLKDMVINGVQKEVGEEPITVDNGTMTLVLRTLFDEFYDNGKGTDRYDWNGEGIDSWIIAIPVIPCFDCNHSEPVPIQGFVCFEINEVYAAGREDMYPPETGGTPELGGPGIIRGHFICPDDPLIDECDFGDNPEPGRWGGGIPAEIPVLVQ